MPTTSRITALVVSCALAAAACSSNSPTVDASAYLAFREQPTACGAARPDAATRMSFEAPDDMGVTGPIGVIIQTSCGDLAITLDPAAAPATVNSFVFLAEQGYFDGTAVHRVAPGFVVQMGDPNAGGGGGLPGYRLPDELPPAGYVYPQYVVAMANAGPNTGGSQFFITLEELPLPPNYTVFGVVNDGFEALAAMAAVPLAANSALGEISRPTETIYL